MNTYKFINKKNNDTVIVTLDSRNATLSMNKLIEYMNSVGYLYKGVI